MSDLISRQAILKHIEKTRQGLQMMDDTLRASTIMSGMYLCEKAVRKQPSAQHDAVEVIRCKDCKWKQGAECTRFAEVRPFPCKGDANEPKRTRRTGSAVTAGGRIGGTVAGMQ